MGVAKLRHQRAGVGALEDGIQERGLLKPAAMPWLVGGHHQRHGQQSGLGQGLIRGDAQPVDQPIDGRAGSCLRGDQVLEVDPMDVDARVRGDEVEDGPVCAAPLEAADFL